MHHVTATRRPLALVAALVPFMLLALLHVCCCDPAASAQPSDASTVQVSQSAPQPHDVAVQSASHCAGFQSWQVAAAHDHEPTTVASTTALPSAITAYAESHVRSDPERGPPATGVHRLLIKCVLQA